VLLAMVSLVAAAYMLERAREGMAFGMTALTIVALTGASFTALFPRVMVSTLGARESLTIWNAASAHETLLVMTVVAAIFTPFVLAYQGWSYWVLRQRLGRPPGSREDGTPSAGPLPDHPLAAQRAFPRVPARGQLVE